MVQSAAIHTSLATAVAHPKEPHNSRQASNRLQLPALAQQHRRDVTAAVRTTIFQTGTPKQANPNAGYHQASVDMFTIGHFLISVLRVLEYTLLRLMPVCSLLDGGRHRCWLSFV